MDRRSLPPGFRFHPTDVELVMYYLKKKIMGKKFRCEVIAEIDIYKFNPWDLKEKSSLRSRDLEWYFFCPRNRRHTNGSRMSRATSIGYWKTTGNDRPICHNSRTVGMKKTLIFHIGRSPKVDRTDWVMHEYRLEDSKLSGTEFGQDAYVLCKVFEKSGSGPRNGEEHGAPFVEDEWDDESDSDSLSEVAHPIFSSERSLFDKKVEDPNSLLNLDPQIPEAGIPEAPQLDPSQIDEYLSSFFCDDDANQVRAPESTVEKIPAPDVPESVANVPQMHASGWTSCNRVTNLDHLPEMTIPDIPPEEWDLQKYLLKIDDECFSDEHVAACEPWIYAELVDPGSNPNFSGCASSGSVLNLK